MKIIAIMLALLVGGNNLAYAFIVERKTIYIYQDEGVGNQSLFHTVSSLQSVVAPLYTIKTINASAIIAGNWKQDAALLVMPGGADIPYKIKLQGMGNKQINDYVQEGGSYLGICAGAYYASSMVEFDKGGELEVIEPRELAFFRGKAIGPILAKYDYKSNSGAQAATVELSLNKIKRATVYYNGGSYFDITPGADNVQTMAYYNNKLPAIIFLPYFQGKVMLSGVHFEYDPLLFDLNDIHLNKLAKTLTPHNAERKLLLLELLRQLGLKI